MSGNITDILNDILSDKENAQGLINSISKLKSGGNADEGTDLPVFPKSEKQIMLQRKIELLNALKPLFGDEFSKKADLLINALTAAKIILSLKNETPK